MTSYKSIATLAVALILLAGYQFIGATWTPAPSTPPNDNADAPINVSSTTQQKAGNFMANIVAAATSTWSPEYCDELGNNCWDPATGGAGGAWVPSNSLIYNGSIIGSGAVDTGGVDLNLSSIVGARETLVQLLVMTSDNTSNSFTFKPKGVAGVQGSTIGSGIGAGSAGVQVFGAANRIGYVTVTTNSSGVVLMQSYATQNVQVRLVGYIGNGSGGGGSTGESNFGGIYTLDSYFVCDEPNPYTGNCSCPSGYIDSVFADQVSGGEQHFHQCWSGGGSAPAVTASIINNWPDVLVCTNNSPVGVGSSNGTKMMLFADYMPYTPTGRYYYRTPASGGVYVEAVFNPDGTWYSGASSDCTGKNISQLATAGLAFSLGAVPFQP